MATVLQGNGGDAVLLSPEMAATVSLPHGIEHQLRQLRTAQAHGNPTAVAQRLVTLAAQTEAGEMILTTPIHDPGAHAQS
jgi:hypothetical protein